ncbi:E4 protein [Talpa europaea papillomavirus 1]|uniref:E4 protein n=1 Tax=Talpa europaea papillomavirus 1 TaxID=1338506 RepID=R9RZ79_9PAPI|nr:E4 protein [Talpa europaea papillomavirus 1]
MALELGRCLMTINLCILVPPWGPGDPVHTPRRRQLPYGEEEDEEPPDDDRRQPSPVRIRKPRGPVDEEKLRHLQETLEALLKRLQEEIRADFDLCYTRLGIPLY